MTKRGAIQFLVFMLGLACIIPNLTVASSDVTSTFNISDNNSHCTLHFGPDKELIPGTALSKSFIINNQQSFQIELKHIQLDHLMVKKNQTILEPGDEAYKEFVKTATFKLTHDHQVIFEGLCQDLFNGSLYIPPVKTFFKAHAGDTFHVSLTLLPESNNLTQHMKVTFDIHFYFEHTPYNPLPDPQPDSQPDQSIHHGISQPEPTTDPVEPPIEIPEEPIPLAEPSVIPQPDPSHEPSEIMVIDDSIPKMGILLDGDVLIGVSIVLLSLGLFLTFFNKAKYKVE